MPEEIAKFAREYGANRIATAESPSPRFKAISQQLQELGFETKVHGVDPFLNYEGRFDLKRFSRYWRVAQKYVFD